MFIFSKNENKNKVRKQQRKYFFIFWPRQELTLLVRIFIHNGKSGIT